MDRPTDTDVSGHGPSGAADELRALPLGVRRADQSASTRMSSRTTSRTLRPSASKPDTVVSHTRDPERLESGAFTDPKRMLEVLGGGTLAGTSVVHDRQGFLSNGGELDVAFEGPGYLTVQQKSPSGQSIPLLTRDGRFTIDTSGRLASINDGAPLLDVNGRPIVVERGAPIRIHTDGRVEQRGTEIASLRIVEPEDPSSLTKVGASRFHAGDSPLRDTRATASLRQNMIEESATDPTPHA